MKLLASTFGRLCFCLGEKIASKEKLLRVCIDLRLVHFSGKAPRLAPAQLIAEQFCFMQPRCVAQLDITRPHQRKVLCEAWMIFLQWTQGVKPVNLTCVTAIIWNWLFFQPWLIHKEMLMISCFFTSIELDWDNLWTLGAPPPLILPPSLKALLLLMEFGRRAAKIS